MHPANGIAGGAKCEIADHHSIHEKCNVESCTHSGLKREVWENQNGNGHSWDKEDGHLRHTQPGTTAMEHNADGTFTHSPAAPDVTATGACSVSSFESPVDSVKDGTQRISGLFNPPEDGEYTFSLAADDAGKLFFGTKVVRAPACTASTRVGPGLGSAGGVRLRCLSPCSGACG